MRSPPGLMKCALRATVRFNSTCGFQIRRRGVTAPMRTKCAHFWNASVLRSRRTRAMRHRWILPRNARRCWRPSRRSSLRSWGSILRTSSTSSRNRALLGLPPSRQLPKRAPPKNAGADVVVAQGMEAGGHRDCFDAAQAERQLVGLFALVPAVVDAVKVPVVATGGIADARGVAAALLLGASAA